MQPTVIKLKKFKKLGIYEQKSLRKLLVWTHLLKEKGWGGGAAGGRLLGTRTAFRKPM